MIRIIGGKWRGTQLNTTRGHHTRPTANRTRQAVFNILEHNPSFLNPHSSGLVWPGQTIIDGFAGSGALGLECLSRGALKVYFFEQHHESAVVIKRNIQRLSCNNQADIIIGDILHPPALRSYPSSSPADLVFLDPPYSQGLLWPTLQQLEHHGWLQKNYRFVLEMHQNESLPNNACYHFWRTENYGISKIVFGWRLTIET